jgi:hypothetical protein
MPFLRAIAAAALFSAAFGSAAVAFETTSIGGTNADGSAKFQDPDELGGLTSDTPSSPFGNFNFSVGSAADRSANSATTNWLNNNAPGTGGFGFSGSSQSSSAEPASPFNTPILRDRN